MNRIYTISLFFFCLLFSTYPFSEAEAQTTEINRLDNQGMRQGKWRKADTEGKLIYEGEFKDNRPDGKFTYYDSTQKVKAISLFSEAGSKTQATTFNRFGKKSSEGTYINEKREGIWKFYNDNEYLIAEEYYENGIPSGIWKNYYHKGALLEEITYKKGKKEGPWKQYFEDGPLKLSATFEDGKLEGLATFYHPNGKVKISGPYKNNFKDNVWMHLNDKNVAEKKEIWSDGILIAEEYYDKALERMVKEEK